VYIGFNPISDEGAEYIAQLIASSCNMSKLDLWECTIGEKGSEKICASVEANSSLVGINLSDIDLNEKCISSLEKNRYIVEITRGSECYRIEERNFGLWKERIRWCCVLNWICRGMVLGGEWVGIPLGMIYYILRSVPPKGMLREGEKMGRI